MQRDNSPQWPQLRSYLITAGLALLSIAALTVGVISLAQQFTSDQEASAAPPNEVVVETSSPTAVTATTSMPTASPMPVELVASSPTSSLTVATSPTQQPAPLTATLPAGVKPNELGEIVILEYHIIGDQEERWTRPRANFRRDLEMLYERGYRLISILDYLDNNIAVPAGYTPVIITFDDSNRSQFQLVKGPNGEWMADPKTAVGILEQFVKEHPDFGRSLTFSVLPGAEAPNDLFGQPELAREKLNYLVERGHVLASHTFWHMNLALLSKAEVAEQLGRAQEAIDKLVPGYKLRVLTMPLGEYPKNVEWAKAGIDKGVSYRHEMMLQVGADPAPAPNHRSYDPYYTPRVQAIKDELDRVFGRFEKNPEERYISDGDTNTITFPKALEPELNRASLGDKKVRTY